jgi:ferredoxin
MIIALIYFSPTGNTRTVAKRIKKILQEFEGNISEFDITSYDDRDIVIDLSKYDACFFGFPVHGWRVPKLLREWFQTLDGLGTKCSAFFTYGGINPGVAHYDIQQILQVQGFHLLSTAEFLGEHTYNIAGWEAAVNRPDETDLNVAEQYTKLTYRKFQQNGTTLPSFKKPSITDKKLEKIENRPKKIVPIPEIESELCTKCGTCVRKCPTSAIELESLSIKSTNCIRCYRCVNECPEKAITFHDLSIFFDNLKKIENISDSAKSKYFI